MSIYNLYKTETEKEKHGVPVLFADEEIRLTLARAGGGNTKYDKVIAANAKPYKRAIQSDLITTEKANDILYKTFAEAVILKWETKVDEVYEEGLQLEGVEALQPATPANMIKVFRVIPDLFEEIKIEATKIANFRMQTMEEDSKN